MTIQELSTLYGACPQAGALVKVLADASVARIFMQGIQASATPLLFASVADRLSQSAVFILPDADEAGYFYHDLTQVLGQERVLFFPRVTVDRPSTASAMPPMRYSVPRY